MPASQWPRLTVNQSAHSYSIDIQLSQVDLPPNTPYAVGTGLGQILGSVQASSTSLYNTGWTPPKNNAPPVAQKITSALLWQHWAQGYYRGVVILTNGIPATLEVDIGGDGGHTVVVFQQHGIFYSVGNYHSARAALQMAASMIPIRS